MNEFEKRNNTSTRIEIYGDGSGNIMGFWNDDVIKSFETLEDLNLFLLSGRLKRAECGRSISPIEIIK